MPYDRKDFEEVLAPPMCKHCGSTDVRWRQQGGKWVLFSLQPGVEHRCPLPSDDFEVLTDA
jgi:hypothetical protein